MENKEEYYFNSRLYDQKGNRLGVWGIEKDGNVRILINKCSKNDQFSKKLSNKIFNKYLQDKPILIGDNYTVEVDNKEYHLNYHYFCEILEGDSAKYTFEEYCKNNFYKKVNRDIKRGYNIDILEKEGEASIYIEKSAKRLYKMDKSYK